MQTSTLKVSQDEINSVTLHKTSLSRNGGSVISISVYGNMYRATRGVCYNLKGNQRGSK